MKENIAAQVRNRQALEAGQINLEQYRNRLHELTAENQKIRKAAYVDRIARQNGFRK